jgi:hypothetical protein
VSAPQDVLEALATSLEQVYGLNVYSYTPGSVSTPAAVCEIAGLTSPSHLGGGVDYTIRVLLLVQAGDQAYSQERTLELIDPSGSTSTSVLVALLDYDPATAVEFEGPSLVEFGGALYAGGIFTTEVYG